MKSSLRILVGCMVLLLVAPMALCTTNNVKVNNVKVVASFNSTNIGNSTFQFTDTSIGNHINSWNWKATQCITDKNGKIVLDSKGKPKFVPGTTVVFSHVKNPKYKFSKKGIYQVELKITNGGSSNSCSKLITVS